MGNSCNSKKNGTEKFLIFSDFLENGVEFLHCVCIVLRRSRGSTEWLKKFQNFLETFPPEGAKCFYRVFLKVRWRFSRYCRGPLAQFGRAKAAA